MLIMALGTSILSNSQNGTPEALAKLPGAWKKGQQGSINNVSATDLVKEKRVITNIHKWVSDSYKPAGCQVSYSTVFGK